MKPDIDHAPLVLRRTERGLEPRSRLASDLLSDYALHSEVEVRIKKRRSSPQNALYWVGLARLVEATDAYPTTQAIHNALKLDLGYTTPIRRLNGEIVWEPDSTAFSNMHGPDFQRYFDKARKLVIETFGCDPWAEAADNEA